jgi:hypothetical protein
VAPDFLGRPEIQALKFYSWNSDAFEGGELRLNKSNVSGTLADSVTFDVYQDKIRIFETGGGSRGLYFDVNTGLSGTMFSLVGSGSVRSGELSPNTVWSGNIQQGQVGDIHLAIASIVSGKIASGTIGKNELSSGVISSGYLADNSVSTNAIAYYNANIESIENEFEENI